MLSETRLRLPSARTRSLPRIHFGKNVKERRASPRSTTAWRHGRRLRAYRVATGAAPASRPAPWSPIATGSAQMLAEEFDGAIPGQLGRGAVVHGLALLVDEGVFGVIAIQLERLASGLHRLLEAVNQFRRAPVVLVGEMRLQRDLHVRRLCRLLRRNAVEHHAGGQLRNFGGADDRHRAAETEAGQADLAAIPGEILRRAAHGLRGGVHEIERVHLFGGAVGVVIGHHRALEQVGRQRVEAGQREPVAQSLDLLGKAPPFLDHDHARRVAAPGVGEIAVGILAVRTLERDVGTHGFLRCFPELVDLQPFCPLRGPNAIGNPGHRPRNDGRPTKKPLRGLFFNSRLGGAGQCAAAQTLFLVKYNSPVNRIRNTNTCRPSRLRASMCGSAAHIRNVVTSWAYCATVAGAPSSKVTWPSLSGFGILMAWPGKYLL